MKKTYLPRDKTFWKYHISGMSIFVAYQTLMIIFIHPSKLFNTVASIIWVIAVTCCVLYIRVRYNRKQWYNLSIAIQILRTLLISVAFAPFITIIILATTLPFFFDSVFTEAFLEKYETTANNHILWLFFSNSVTIAMILNLWTFLYIGITTNRRAQETLLNNLRLENSLKEARLAGLASQLNPHFLFNSLNNIRFKIHENADYADKMITALSEILRYSLEGGKKERVTLEEELVITQQYIDILRLQLEDRLDYQLNIAPSQLAYLIPPMTLQMLVENAIKHGIDNIREKSILEVTCNDQSNQLLLSVTNPTAAETSTGHHLLENSEKNTGIGLKNIQQRLTLLYGDRASITTSQAHHRFHVEIRLPKETEAL